MKLKEIYRTSTFAWSPAANLPTLATGTVAGALDESFSNASQLEIWAPNFLDKDEYDLGHQDLHGPKGFVEDTSRFNRLAWGCVNTKYPQGVIAAGMENGELALWDPSQILAQAGSSDSLILRNTTHTGPIRGLDFNPMQTHLLSSGGTGGEVYIWDLNNPETPRGPTDSRSSKLDEITSIAWNRQVAHVLAGASTTGYTVVWDLRGKREVVALAYGGGAGTMTGQNATSGGVQAVGGRRGMSAIAWHPDNATRLVTASEDDSSPVIMVWDLRNARAPEKILTGHEKGVLSLSWCKQDADLLLSCGKDNRALCWNPQTSEIIGELPSAENWAFQVDWCPRNPDMLAAAFFDGTIGIHSIQTTNDESASHASARVQVAPKADGTDLFDLPSFGTETARQTGTFSLKQPPKWLRRPVTNSFGFGGKLVTSVSVTSSKAATVTVKKVVTETELVERANTLQAAIADSGLSSFAEQKREGDLETWKALRSLFNANSRDQLVTLLGYSKEDIKTKVAEAIAKLQVSSTESTPGRNCEHDIAEVKTSEPVVSFADPESSAHTDEEAEHEEMLTGEKTPSEVSVGATSDATSAARQADGESTTTAPSLFGDDNAIGTPQTDAAADFFSTMGLGPQSTNAEQVLVPHHNYGLDSSVAATIGSRASSVASEALKSNTFRIYPINESEIDRLVTKALVLGDFESAVTLCLSADRFADAILLAGKGGHELLQKTQKVYFERQTASLPYLRVFQSIVTNDLADIVQNADLKEWQEIFVVLCTFASPEEFSSLTEQLGQRLEFQFSLAKLADGADPVTRAREFRKNAILTYLAAGRLERLINIWIEELSEEEKQLSGEQSGLRGSRYTAHAHALQTFIEKVTVFRSATNYVDSDLGVQPTVDAAAKTYKLGALYDRYYEYADLLAAQGLVHDAVAFLKLTPTDYAGPASSSLDFDVNRKRLLAAAGVLNAPAVPTKTAAKTPQQPPAASSGYVAYANPMLSHIPQPLATYASYTAPTAPAAPVSSGYNPYQAQPVTNAYQAPPVAFSSIPNGGYQPPVASQSASAYQPSNNPYQQQSTNYSGTQQPIVLQGMPPPARVAPPPQKRDNGGWNDAPAVKIDKRAPSNLGAAKPSAITSPFPNATPQTPGTPFSPGMGGPPPRPGSVQAGAQRMVPPPPRVGSTGPHPPPPPRVGSTGPVSPPPHPRQGTPSQYGPPSVRNVSGVGPPHFSRGTPPPPPPSMPRQQPPGPPPQSSQFAPPPSRQSGASYNAGQPGAPPLPQTSIGPYGPPPGNIGQIQPPLQPLARGEASPPVSSATPPPARAQPRGPPPPKYPPGDRSHIPGSSKPIYETLSQSLLRLKQNSPPQQQRLVEDLERRVNSLFDALNCDSLSTQTVTQLSEMTQAINAGHREMALAIHVDLLTKGSQTDNIGLWMSGVKQLIMRA